MYSFVAPTNMLISHSVMNDIDGQDRLSPDTRGLPGLWLASILHRKMFFFYFGQLGHWNEILVLGAQNE
jgi:hypothetical protein